ncbi:MAG: glycosyltransferase [Oscillospiraceae bacterium]
MGFDENCGPVIGSYGFLFEHKGILEAIQAVALLKKKYPHIFYMPCCSIYTASETSVNYYEACQAEIRKLGIEKHVNMISDFLEAKESAYLLQACDATVMAYGHTNESASGAIRFCVAANRPMVTTKEQIFDEFAECALQIENNSPKTIAAGLDKLLSEGESEARKIAMERMIAKTSWDTVGKAYLKLYETLNSGK